MKKGLKLRLLYSHGLIAVLGTILLLFCLSSVLILRSSTKYALEEILPIIQMSEDLQTSLYKSSMSLRNWMNLGEERFKEERKKIWDKDIDLNWFDLYEKSSSRKEKELRKQVLELKPDLELVRMWQWRVEDISQTKGDSLRDYKRYHWLNKASDRIMRLITTIIDIEKKDSKKEEMIYKMADFRGFFLKSTTSLGSYIITGSDADLKQHEESLQVAKKNIESLLSLDDNLNPAQKENLKTLYQYFFSYKRIASDIIIKKTSGTSSQNIYRKNLIPEMDFAIKKIEKIISAEKEKEVVALNQLERIQIAIIGLIIFFSLFMMILSVWIASLGSNKILRPINLLIESSRRIARGEANKNIEVISDDEIGDLTKSFNEMLNKKKIAEEKIQQTINTAVDPIITINARGMMQQVNRAAIEMTGYSEEEILGNNISMMMPDPHRSNHDQYLENYHKTRTRKIIGSSREVELLCKSGEKIPVLLGVSEIKVGDEVLFTGILRDIRKEKNQLAKIEENNKKLALENKESTLVSGLEKSIRGIDDLETLSNNVLAYLSEAFGSKLSMFYIMEDKNLTLYGGYGFKERRNRKTAFKIGEGLLGESIREKRIISISEVPEDYFKVSSGFGDMLPKFIIIIPLIFESTPLGAIELCFIEKPSESDFIILEKIRDSLNILLKMSIDKKEMSELLEKTEKQREDLRVQEEELRSNNEELEVQTQSLKQAEEELRSVNDELQAQVALIEEQKEEITQKAEMADKASQYKSEFLANMSHELRTPLNSLLILAQSFMGNKSGNLTEEQQEEAKIIYEAGKDLLTLINDILDISKIEAGKLTIENMMVEISSIEAILKRQFEPLAKERGIAFNVLLDKNTPEEIETDQVRVMQILKNLISNGIKFTHEGSVNVRIYSDKESVYFEVSDTGIGIPKEKQEMVFSEFQQADGSTSRKYGGTGLGLSISRKLSSLMGGELSLESEADKGSKFTLKLPLKAPKIQTKTMAPTNHQPIATEQHLEECITIPEEISIELEDDRELIEPGDPILLVIDDDRAFNKHTQKLVKRTGNKVLSALSGNAGLVLAAKFKPAGIILDLGLPDISGREVLEKLKKDSRTANIPVHIISSEDKSEDEIKRGALSFLQKPVQEEDLEGLIKELFKSGEKRILLVEDDLIVQKGLIEILASKEKDIEIDCSATVEKAKEDLTKETYACVIVDLGLPDSSGVDLIKFVANEIKNSPPIIVYTARDLLPEEFKEIKQYADKVVIKGAEAMERLTDEIQLFAHHVSGGSETQVEPPSMLPNDGKHKFSGQKVLLVDDDLRNTFALSKVLESEGLSVIIADNGELAIEKLKKEGADIILMDMMMPIMDGYEASQKIKNMEGYRSIPIIALTAKATQKDREECIESGADDYMSKPIDVPSLLTLMSIWLSNTKDIS